MFLIVGLGNPGREYSNTRHNVGFVAIDALSKKYNLILQTRPKFNAELAFGDCDLGDVLLCKPETYMNLSGHAVQSVSSYYKLQLSQIIVIHDDIDLPLGKIKYKIGGGAGGHNGLKSLDQYLGQNYHRIRIGIGKPDDPQHEISDFVLGKFHKKEEAVILRSIDLLTSKIKLLITGEIEAFKKEISFSLT